MAQISVPDIGDFKDVEVIDVLVKPGDTVALEAPLITIETEKATMDVPASKAGRVKSVTVKKGDRVSKGSIILEMDEAAAEGAAKSPGNDSASRAPQEAAGTAASKSSESAAQSSSSS